MPTASATPTYPAAYKYQGGIAQGYLHRRDNHPTWRWEQSSVEQYVRSYPGPATVLDVPFGTGRYVPLYVAAQWQVHGCDISRDMVAEAEGTLGAELFSRCDVQIAPAENMPFADNSMDVIVSSRFIQWLPQLGDVDRVIGEFSRVGRGDLFLQLRIPGEGRSDTRRAGVGPMKYLRKTMRALRRRIRPASPLKAKIVCHREADLLAITEAHGWRLERIGLECPTSSGLRFYKFKRA